MIEICLRQLFKIIPKGYHNSQFSILNSQLLSPIFPVRHSLFREVFVMNGCFITFRSVTHAQRGEQVLGGGGIYCRILRTPRWMEEQGCGYCIRLRRRDLETAV